MLRMFRGARRVLEREAFDLAEAERAAQGKTTGADVLIGDKADPGALPDLGQVSGWSKATGWVVDPERALFGGWRVKERPGKGRSDRRQLPSARTNSVHARRIAAIEWSCAELSLPLAFRSEYRLTSCTECGRIRTVTRNSSSITSTIRS